MSRSDISIIIPVLNEAGGIVQALQRLQEFRARGAEIIVVDGGSDDDTARLSLPFADCLTTAACGRGEQMNAGARKASGGILLFLHADTQLPPSAPDLIATAIAGGACWGRFDVRIDGSPGALALVAMMMNWRSRLTGIATGDQAIFVTRETFQASGGYPAIPLMEDIVFSGWMRRIARPACLREKVTTSGRRWEKHGLLRTILKMWWLRLRFHFGASPDDLAREYGYAVRKN
jgi:rSAM/selenodomain-associated transferase 2